MKRLALIAALVMLAAAPALAQAPDLPALDDGQVIMKWNDFEKILRELMKPPEQAEETSKPPVGFSIKSASFDVAIEDGFAEVRADYDLEVLADREWVLVPVGDFSSGIHAILVDGKPGLAASLSREEGGQYQMQQAMNMPGPSGANQVVILLKGRGAHQVSVSHAVAAPQNPGPNSFFLKVAEVSGAALSLSAPAELSDLAPGGAVVTGQKKGEGGWTVSALSGHLASISVSYSVPAAEGALGEVEKLPPRLYSTIELLLSISDEVARASALFRYDIKHSPLSQFSISVPAGWEVINVDGQGVSGWKVSEGVLSVMVNYEVQGSYSLMVELESKREKSSGRVEMPALATVDCERESGEAAVETRDSLEVQVGALVNLSAVDASELSGGLRSRARYPIIYAFRFSKQPYAGALEVTRHQEVEVLTAAIDTINLVTLFTRDGKSLTRVIYEVRNNKRQYIKIGLPEKAEIWGAFVDDEPIKPSINDQGQTLIPLKKSGAEGGKVSFSVELIYYAPAPKMEGRGKMTTVFPRADIPASEMLVSMYLPPDFKYSDFEGDLEEEKQGQALSLYAAPTEGPRGQAAPAPVHPEADKYQYSKRAISRQADIEQELADEIMRSNAPAKATPGPAPPGAPSRSGMLPVKFSVPLRGSVHRFSKLLVMDEAPELEFKYKEIKKPLPWRYIVPGAIVAVLVVLLFLRRRSKKLA